MLKFIPKPNQIQIKKKELLNLKKNIINSIKKCLTRIRIKLDNKFRPRSALIN
jgi:hypothetical protein